MSLATELGATEAFLMTPERLGNQVELAGLGCLPYLGYRPTPTSCISALQMVNELQITCGNKKGPVRCLLEKSHRQEHKGRSVSGAAWKGLPKHG